MAVAHGSVGSSRTAQLRNAQLARLYSGPERQQVECKVLIQQDAGRKRKRGSDGHGERLGRDNAPSTAALHRAGNESHYLPEARSGRLIEAEKV